MSPPIIGYFQGKQDLVVLAWNPPRRKAVNQDKDANKLLNFLYSFLFACNKAPTWSWCTRRQEPKYRFRSVFKIVSSSEHEWSQLLIICWEPVVSSNLHQGSSCEHITHQLKHSVPIRAELASVRDDNMETQTKILILVLVILGEEVVAKKGGGRRAVFRSSGLHNQNKHYGYGRSQDNQLDYDCELTRRECRKVQPIFQLEMRMWRDTEIHSVMRSA